MAVRILSAAVACVGLPTALGGLPPFTAKLRDELWQQATEAVGNIASLPQGQVCGAGTWGDSGQVDQWDTGRSPCWPSTMTISASWDTELMARWSVEIGEEFGGAGRGQLGPGINIARFPWNGRLGEYMGGEDPFFGARMIEAQVAAIRTIDHPAIQVAKHFIPNTIENHRTDMIEVVDERTLFEVYYPAFEAAVNAGVSAIMCSYNAVQCTTGKCDGKAAYACVNDDTLNKHLKDSLGFKGIVMSDWDATKCRGEAGTTLGCTPGQYIDNDVAAEGGLDLEMPSCMTFSGGVTKRAAEKAARWRWAFMVQGQNPPGRRLSANASEEAAGRRLQGYKNVGWCGCSWLGHDNCKERTKCAVQCRTANNNPGNCPESALVAKEAPATPAPAPAPAPSPSPDWTSGVYKSNPFGDAAPAPAPKPDWTSGVYKSNPFGDAAPAPAPPPTNPSGPSFTPSQVALTGDKCPDMGSNNVKSPCKLALADKIIVESTVVLKNSGDVLPLTKERKVVLIGKEACASDPLAIGGGSGWNGPSCNEVAKINVKSGIAGLKNGPGNLACPDQADGGSSLAAGADVIVAVVTPAKASEGTDRPTLQLHAEDVALIKKYAATGKPVVVAMNAPGPMITNTFDSDVAAMIVSWLPGQQNGRGIAMALYNEDYEASGRLPFTWPKCKTQACTQADELASVPLGDKIAGNQYYKFEEKALIGYRWYHANRVEPHYPFGFGLFAYGSAEIVYSSASASVDASTGVVTVSASLAHSGPRAGKDVAQLYLSFPTSVPGDAASKPEWVLKGYQKKTVEPGVPATVSFTLPQRELSYWDDAPGASHWVCASGTFRVCVGANARDAIDAAVGACASFTYSCTPGGHSAAGGELMGQLASFLKKDAEPSQGHPIFKALAGSSLATGALGSFLGVAAVATAVMVTRRARSSSRVSYDQVDPLVAELEPASMSA